MPITFLDEEEGISPIAPPTKRKITFLDEEDTAISPTIPQTAQPPVTQSSTYKYDPTRFRPMGLAAPKAEQEIGTLEGIANAARNAFDSSRQALDIVGDVTPEEAQNIAKIEFDKQSRKVAPGYDEYQKAEGFDAVLAFAKNPIEVTSNIVAEGLAGSLPALGAGLAAGGVGAAAGSVAPVVGTAAGFTAGQIAGTFAGSLATEYGSKILEEMQNEGVDLTKPESIQGFFENEEAVTKARDKALARGIPVAAFDAISAGIGGKLGRVLGKEFLTKTGEAAAELGVQAALGGGGEVAGALAAGEPIEGKAVFGEVIGEVGPGAAEVITGRMADRAARVKAEEERKIKAAAQLSDNLEQNSAPLTAAAVKSTTATTIEQDKLAAQLEEQLDADELVAVKQPTAAPPAIKSKEEFTAIYSQVAPEELDAAEAGFTRDLAAATTEEARANAQNALEAIKEVKATITPPTPPAPPVTPITPEVTPAVPTAQPPITDATKEIIQPEGVREEPQDRVEGETPAETIARNRILGSARGEEEGQVVTTPTAEEPLAVPPAEPAPAAEVAAPVTLVPVEPTAIVEQEVAPAEPKGTRVAAAAYIAPDGTQYTGPSHLAAMEQAKNEGKITQAEIDAKQAPESRETPQFGYKTDAEPFVTRDQAEGIARSSGQLLVEKPATGQLHSNEVSLDEFPKAPTPATPTPVTTPLVTEAVTPAPAPTEAVAPAPKVAAPTEFEFAKEIEAPRENIKKNMIRFASGMSAIGDLKTGTYARGGFKNYGVGFDVGLLSKNAIDSLASSVINLDTQVFIDSGAFSNFKKSLKEKANGRTVEALDFDKIFEKYDSIVDAINKANPEERTDYPRPLMVMPDIIGDQKASLDLIEKYKDRIAVDIGIQTFTPIIPIPLGDLSLSQAYNKIVEILNSNTRGVEVDPTNFIVGIPSNAKAVSKEDLSKFLRESKPPRIHFLGAAADRNIAPLIETVAQNSPETAVTADASKVRSAILNGVAKGKTRKQAIFDALYQEDDPEVILNKIPEETSKTEPTTPAPPAPEGISVGNRIKLGKSPQTYTVEEVIPQSATERELGEQYYSVKNERTGETQVVEERDLKKVGGKRVRNVADELKADEEAPPVPKENRYTPDESSNLALDFFGGVAPENLSIIEDETNPEFNYKAAYYPETGEIILNLAYIEKGDNIADIITHELGHYIFSDPQFQEDFKSFFNGLSADERAEIDDLINQAYNEETKQIQIEEKQVIAFASLVKKMRENNRTAWEKLKDAIKSWINRVFNTNIKLSDRGAMAVMASAYKRFGSNEQIIREMEDGVLKMSAKPRQEQVGGKQREETRYITTPKGILSMNTDVLREKFFDGTSVSTEKTTQAWEYISRLLDIKSGNANEFAGEINDTIDADLLAKREAAIAAGEKVDPEEDVNKRIGASMLSVELMNYAGKLAEQGDTKMLKFMIRNVNSMPTDKYAGDISDAARALRTRLEYDVSGFYAYIAEQSGKLDRTAATMFGTSNPSKDQVNAVKDAIDKSEKTELVDADQVATDIKNVEGRTKTNLIDKIDAKVSQAIDKSGKIKELEGKATRPRSIDAQAESVIESLQRSLGELPPLPQRRESDIRAIVKQDLRQNPDMGRREPWNNMLIGRLIQAGVTAEQAQTIADLTWKQHEQKSINRELKEMRKAVEEGSLAVIIDRIKNTSLERQQSLGWRQEVIKEYLRDAGLSSQAAETAAKLYDSVISERLAAAKQKAFEDTLAKSAPWKNYASRNGKLAKDALKKIKEAIRTGVLDPEKNAESIIAAQSGWTGFTKEQYQRIVELDTILNDPNQDDITKREAMDALNKIIAKAKMPVRFKDALGAYYIGNALMGIPTALVNISSPLGFSIRNLVVDIAKYAKENPAKIPVAFETFLDSMRSWYNQTSYAFKNQIYLNDVVEYLNGQNVLRETFDKGKKQWAEGKYAEGFANMAVGMTQITGRVLSALDQGAISMLENQNITRYAMAALENAKKKVPKNKIVEFANMTLDLKRRVIAENIAAGMDKNRAGVLADLAVKSELRAALSEYGADTQSVLDSAINDALQAVGRNKVITIDGIKAEQQRISDTGALSYWPIKMLENVSEGAGSESPGMQIFAKMVYGFALVPARTFHTAAWFSPYGFLRLAIDKYKKNKGQESPYAMSLQTEAQYRQRLTEAIAGSIVMLGLFALRSGSSDEDEDKKFKIVITGNGPNATTDKQYYDSWIKKYKPYSVHIVVGDTVFPINIGRGGEALFFPIMLAGAMDDYEIKKKQNLTKKEPSDLNIATEMLGSAFFAFAQRGPYAAFTEPLFDASKQGRVTENLVGQLGYFGKTFVPVLGASITRNISDFINDPVDRSSIEGALYANTPVVGPWIGTKALNALGQPIRADDWGDKLYKLGVPLVFSFPKNTPENALNELILKQGSGPTIPTRANAQKRFGDVLTDKEFETYVREYGRVMSDKMFKNRTRLASMKASDYDDELEKYARGYSIDGIKIKGASDSAVLAVKRMRQ